MGPDRIKAGGEDLKADAESTWDGYRSSQFLGPGILRRVALFALVWWILVGGDPLSWWVGLPAVLVAASVSVLLMPPTNMVWYELFRFVPFFLIRSLLGGMDVAWRSLHHGLPIDPHLIEYPMRLPPGLPRVFMANTVSLLPGTLSAMLNSDYLTVHVLAKRKDLLSELETLERRVAALFRTSLTPASGGMR